MKNGKIHRIWQKNVIDSKAKTLDATHPSAKYLHWNNFHRVDNGFLFSKASIYYTRAESVQMVHRAQLADSWRCIKRTIISTCTSSLFIETFINTRTRTYIRRYVHIVYFWFINGRILQCREWGWSLCVLDEP